MDEGNRWTGIRSMGERRRVMKYLIRGIMTVGIIAILLGGSAMDSNSLVTPIVVICLGAGLLSIGAYLDSYIEWYEERR